MRIAAVASAFPSPAFQILSSRLVGGHPSGISAHVPTGYCYRVSLQGAAAGCRSRVSQQGVATGLKFTAGHSNVTHKDVGVDRFVVECHAAIGGRDIDPTGVEGIGLIDIVAIHHL